MPIDFEIQQGLPFVFTNLPNLAWMTFKKAEMAKILRNGPSMIETNPLNHNWSDFAIQSGWALHQFKKNAVKQQLHQKQFPPIVQGKLCQKLAAIIIFIVSCGQNQEPKKFSHRRSCKWHLYCLLRLESELYSNVVCGSLPKN